MGLNINFSKEGFTKFVIDHIVSGLYKAHGKVPPNQKEKKVNLQCVKLTHEHEAVGPILTYWCSLNINRLERVCTAPEITSRIAKRYARFMSAFNYAIAEQKEKQPGFDAWLYFDNDVENTGFFELIQTERGTKEVTSTLVIRANR